MTEPFQEQKKLRNAEMITPPNHLKEKVGSGGISEAIVEKAQSMIETNTVDFRPIATALLEQLDETIAHARTGSLTGEKAIEAMIYPAMQMKSQGSMFHYPLVTEFSDILVNFLETVETADNDVLDIVAAHKMSINVVLKGQIKDASDAAAAELRSALMDACKRYYKNRKS